MTRQQAKKLLPIIKAYSEGADLEVRTGSPFEHGWTILDNPVFNDPPEYYRIKPPEPKLRPWKPEEVPVGAVLNTGHREFIIMGRYTRYGAGYVEISEPNKVTGGWQAHETVGHTYSLDHGKTWQPCGVME